MVESKHIDDDALLKVLDPRASASQVKQARQSTATDASFGAGNLLGNISQSMDMDDDFIQDTKTELDLAAQLFSKDRELSQI